jgi:hypothetical protein
MNLDQKTCKIQTHSHACTSSVPLHSRYSDAIPPGRCYSRVTAVDVSQLELFHLQRRRRRYMRCLRSQVGVGSVWSACRVRTLLTCVRRWSVLGPRVARGGNRRKLFRSHGRCGGAASCIPGRGKCWMRGWLSSSKVRCARSATVAPYSEAGLKHHTPSPSNVPLSFIHIPGRPALIRPVLARPLHEPMPRPARRAH